MAKSIKLKYKVLFNKCLSCDYLFGSKISFKNNTATFKNAYIPSGNVITYWSSKVSYSSCRYCANLPVLHANKVYRVNMNLTSSPSKTILLKVSFFDCYGNVLSNEYHYNNFKLKCPSSYSHYSFELLCAGCTKLDFKSIDIEEV